MIDDPRPCPCRGAIANCCRCNGSGMIRPRSMNRIHSETFEVYSRIKTKQLPKEKAAVVIDYEIDKIARDYKSLLQLKCPFCNLTIEKRELNVHIIVNHIFSANSSANTTPIRFIDKSKYPIKHNSISACKNTVLCKACKTLVTKARFIKHMIKVHKDLDALSAAAKEQLRAFLVSARYEVKCPTCGDFVPTTKFAAHASTCGLISYKISHTKIKKLKIRQAQKQKLSFPVIVEKIADIKFQHPNEIKRLGATFGHHTIRDTGKFGSHPSYDSFDDESKA